MATNPRNIAVAAERLSAEVTRPFPASRKIHVEGSRPDVRVPMREIELAATQTADGPRSNAPLPVYDTSGPYTDTTATIDLLQGLATIRADWIAARDDTERLREQSSAYGRERAADSNLDDIRFPTHPRPLRARAGGNVSQMHYARQGIITPEMEFIAIRENARREAVRDLDLLARHPGEAFGATLPEEITPEFVREEVARGRAIIPPTSITPSWSR